MGNNSNQCEMRLQEILGIRKRLDNEGNVNINVGLSTLAEQFLFIKKKCNIGFNKKRLFFSDFRKIARSYDIRHYDCQKWSECSKPPQRKACGGEILGCIFWAARSRIAKQTAHIILCPIVLNKDTFMKDYVSFAELGHFMLHGPGKNHFFLSKPKKDRYEFEAQACACLSLIPTPIFREAINECLAADSEIRLESLASCLPSFPQWLIQRRLFVFKALKM